MAEDVLANAQDAGTLNSTTLICVAQTTAGTKIQKMARSAMVFASQVTGLDLTNTSKAMTAAAYVATRASTTAVGTVLTSTTAKVAAKSDTGSAMTPSNIPALTLAQTVGVSMVTGDIDGTSTAGVWAIVNLKVLTQGNMAEFNGTLTFTPTGTEPHLDLVINNHPLPAFNQVGTATTVVSALTRSVGMDLVYDASQLTILLGNPESGLSWTGGVTYTIGIQARYFI